MIPSILRDFTLVLDGTPVPGLVETLTLPKLSRKMEDYEGGGMGGPVSLDMGQEALTLSFTLSEFNKTVLTQYGAFGVAALNTRFLGALVDDDGDVDAIEISVRGRWKVLEMGEAKKKDRAKLKVEMPLSYYKYTANSEDVIELDLIEGLEIVGGTDLSADVRSAIGLTY